MKDLIEHIITDDFVSANDILESRIANIVEKKLYEKKRMMQAEAFGGMSKKELEDRRKAGYRKASEVLGDPDKATKLSPAAKKYRESLKKKVSEEILDEAGLAPSTKRAKLYKAGLQAIRDVEHEKDEKTPKDPYEGKGNAPWTMISRGLHRSKQSIKNYKPAAPGSLVVNTSKAIGKSAVTGLGRVAGEISSYSNLEE